MNAQIATHLNIVESAIIEVQEWVNVLWVRFAGRCRFVSKKVVKKMEGQELTALEGSEKQVAWAEGIRAEKLRQMAVWVKGCQELVEENPDDEEYAAELEIAIAALKVVQSKVEAKFWIGYRGQNFTSVKFQEGLVKQLID